MEWYQAGWWQLPSDRLLYDDKGTRARMVELLGKLPVKHKTYEAKVYVITNGTQKLRIVAVSVSFDGLSQDNGALGSFKKISDIPADSTVQEWSQANVATVRQRQGHDRSLARMNDSEHAKPLDGCRLVIIREVNKTPHILMDGVGEEYRRLPGRNFKDNVFNGLDVLNTLLSQIHNATTIFTTHEYEVPSKRPDGTKYLEKLEIYVAHIGGTTGFLPHGLQWVPLTSELLTSQYCAESTQNILEELATKDCAIDIPHGAQSGPHKFKYTAPQMSIKLHSSEYGSPTASLVQIPDHQKCNYALCVLSSDRSSVYLTTQDGTYYGLPSDRTTVDKKGAFEKMYALLRVWGQEGTGIPTVYAVSYDSQYFWVPVFQLRRVMDTTGWTPLQNLFHAWGTTLTSSSIFQVVYPQYNSDQGHHHRGVGPQPYPYRIVLLVFQEKYVGEPIGIILQSAGNYCRLPGSNDDTTQDDAEREAQLSCGREAWFLRTKVLLLPDNKFYRLVIYGTTTTPTTGIFFSFGKRGRFWTGDVAESTQKAIVLLKEEKLLGAF